MQGITKMLVTGATLVAGAVVAMFLMKKLPVSVSAKLAMKNSDGTTTNLAPVLIPVVGGIALAILGTKVKGLKPHMDKVHMASLGMVAFGMLNGLDVFGVKTKLKLNGYVPSMRGYVPSMQGYVPPRNLGQMDTGKSMSRLSAPHAQTGGRPYGTGAPRDQRSYNKFSWSGVYDTSTYE